MVRIFSRLSSVFSIKEGQPILKQHPQLTEFELVHLLKNIITELQVIVLSLKKNCIHQPGVHPYDQQGFGLAILV